MDERNPGTYLVTEEDQNTTKEPKKDGCILRIMGMKSFLQSVQMISIGIIESSQRGKKKGVLTCY